VKTYIDKSSSTVRLEVVDVHQESEDTWPQWAKDNVVRYSAPGKMPDIFVFHNGIRNPAIIHNTDFVVKFDNSLVVHIRDRQRFLVSHKPVDDTLSNKPSLTRRVYNAEGTAYDAWQFTTENQTQWPDWVRRHLFVYGLQDGFEGPRVERIYGIFCYGAFAQVPFGDWLLHSVNGDCILYYPNYAFEITFKSCPAK